jgi:hypothetical protein
MLRPQRDGGTKTRTDTPQSGYTLSLCPDCAATRHLCSMHSRLAYGLLLAVARGVVGDGSNTSPPTSNNVSMVYTHDRNFTPDFYLSVTYENHTVACQQHMSVLVNRTSPGPTLRLPAGKTSWVRVCNDMDEYNTTMVQSPPLSPLQQS